MYIQVECYSADKATQRLTRCNVGSLSASNRKRYKDIHGNSDRIIGCIVCAIPCAWHNLKDIKQLF